MVAPKPVLTPHGYFRRWIEGSDFSLEANTPAVPSDDLFYVLVAGKAPTVLSPPALNTKSSAWATGRSG